MQFNVASLLQEHTGSSREYQIDDDLRIGRVMRRVTGQVRLDRTPRGILVRATVAGDDPGECSRCLKPTITPVEITFDEEYIPLIDVNHGARVELPEGEEDAYRISPRHVLDLSEPIRQYWELVLPMAPLCSDDCLGLCPDCGEELSRDAHACANEQPIGPWAKLANLKLG